MKKTLTKILGITSALCLAATALALNVQARTLADNDGWKGIYAMTAFAEGTAEETVAEQTGTTTLSKTKYLVSTDEQYAILATLITTEDISTVYEVGYTFGATQVTTTVASTTEYYTGIITKASADDATGKRWTSKEIFGTAGEEPMIVWEIGYDPATTYTVESYCLVGERVNDELKPTMPETKIKNQATIPAKLTGLKSIEVTGAPAKLSLIYGESKTLAEALAPYEMTVTANYYDKDSAVVTDYTLTDGAQELTTALTAFTLSYTEDGVTQQATVDVAVQYTSPYEIAKTSQAEYVFYTYYTVKPSATKPSTKTLEGALELFGDGTFKYTTQMAAENYNIISGKYAIDGDMFSFTETALVQVLGSSTMSNKGDESATAVKDESGKIIALNFGTISTDNPFWRYKTGSKVIDEGNISTTAGLDKTVGYMVLIENGEMGDLNHYY